MTHEWDAQGTMPISDVESREATGEPPEERRKRQALACLEEERGRSRNSGSSSGPTGTGSNVLFLQDELRRARAACALMEKDIQRLEQKALDAIAEGGRLRRRLKEMEDQGPVASEVELLERTERLEDEIVRGETERSLLTGALSRSETEIARLVKCADQLIKRMNEH